MVMPNILSYGSWPSPIRSEMVASHIHSLSFPRGDKENLYWSEARPEEKGRVVIVKWNHGEILPDAYSAKTMANEYGGISYLVDEGIVYFIHARDQKIYRIEGRAITPITPDGPYRYADLVLDKKRGLIYAVREEYITEKPVTTLVAIHPRTKEVTVVASGRDFYSNPRLSPSGSHIAYLCWDLPNMPWDQSELILHEIKRDGSLQLGKLIAGNEAICQPLFSPDGKLYFVSDRSGFWNLYRYGKKVEAVYPMEADFAVPMWSYGLSNYAFVPNNDFYDIVSSYTIRGVDHLGILSLKEGKMTQYPLPYTSIRYLIADEGAVYFVGSAPTSLAELIRWDLEKKEIEVLEKSSDIQLEEGMISLPEEIECVNEKGEKIYGFFYPPMHANYRGPPSERPPLIVKCHGGPTAAATGALNLETQFFTTRGIGVLDMNYGGSAGYGRDYRKRLEGNWGVTDVNDACSGALFLAAQGLVDRDRMVIKGGSAGGFTTLAALCFRDVFQGGVSYFGICDLEKMTEESAKFESHYHHTLIGPYPKLKKLYKERSPIHAIDKIQKPLLLFHGKEDKVVLPKQSEEVYQKLQARGIYTSYILFEGEGHGFRQAKSIQKCLEEEMLFYKKVFGLL